MMISREIACQGRRSSFTTQLREMSFHFSAIRTSLLKLRQAQRQKLLNSIETLLELYLHIRPEIKNILDFEKALEYPLCSIPLSLANPDGSPGSTTKSKLLEVITQKCELPLQHPRQIQPPEDSVGAFVVDFMAIVRTVTKIPDTYENFEWRFVKMLTY